MVFRNIVLRYKKFFDYNLPVILAATSFSGSVAGATVTYNTVKPYEKKSCWDYGKIGLGACAGGVAGVIVGALLEPVIIPCAVVAGTASGFVKAFDTVKGK
jgi:hypothetical protein